MKNQNHKFEHAVEQSISTSFNRLMIRLGACSLSVMCSSMLVMMSVSASVAQAQDELRPPKTTEEPSSPKYLILFVAVLLVAGVVFAASLRSKRTHQD